MPSPEPASPDLGHLSSEQLLKRLDLQPHPEGGWYREVFRSSVRVLRADGASRCALTQILYLLPAGGISRWHRVRGADETWQFIAGAPLELWQLAPHGAAAAVCTLLGALTLETSGVPGAAAMPQALAVVPADCWQAARSPDQGWSLVSCVVAPGFEFDDFELLADWPLAHHPAGASVAML